MPSVGVDLRGVGVDVGSSKGRLSKETVLAASAVASDAARACIEGIVSFT
jgi:hypothetical protein